jgi:hypothetical protein
MAPGGGTRMNFGFGDANGPACRTSARVTRLLLWKSILPRTPAGETQNQEAKDA